MSERCLPIEVLVGVPDLRNDDPQRLHAETCPRCRSALHAYQSFLRQPDTLPPGGDAATAERELTGFLRRQILADTGEPGVRSESGSASPENDVPRSESVSRQSPPRRRPSPWGGLRSLISVPAWRPLTAALALVLVVFGIRGLVPGPETSGVLRSSTPGTEAIEVTALTVDDGWNLRWDESSGADGYVVTIFDDAFRKLGELPAQGPGLRVEQTQELRVAAFFQVVAVSGEEQVATSGPLPLP